MRLNLKIIWQKYQGQIIATIAVTIIFSAPVIAILWMTATPGQSYEGALPPLSLEEAESADRMGKHIEIISKKPRNTIYINSLEDSANYIKNELELLGYVVNFQPFNVDKRTVNNIEIVLEPKDKHSKTLIIGAHYDSFYKSLGANDNASGVAATIELARQLKDLNGKSALRIRFVLFVNEEPPYFKTQYMGSAVYANALDVKKEEFLGMLSLETMGYYSSKPNSQRYPFPLNILYPDTGNFIAFVGGTSARSFVRETIGAFREKAQFPSEGGTAPSFVQGIDWSDHRSFSAVGIPALMVTDTAAFRYPQYHSRNDTYDRIDSRQLAHVVSGLEKVIRHWAEDNNILQTRKNRP